jgi:O-antigen/teichoic acid export membrane protein
MPRAILGKWMGRSFWAILDQGLFALSNFILNVILARWLGAESYGSFAIAFTIFLLVGVVHTSLIIEPMLVFGSGRYRESQSAYLSSLLKLHWSWGWLGCAALTGIAGLAYWGNPARGPILAIALLTGTLLYQWLLRRACYLPTRPRIAAEGGALYLLLMLGGIFLMRETGRLSAISGLITMGLASLAAGVLLQWRLTASRSLSVEAAPPRSEMLRQHWTYGRWALFTSVLGWVPANVFMLILPLWGGNAASGDLRAANNLILPVQQLLAAAGPMLLPLLVRSQAHPKFRQRVLWLALGFMIAPLAWAILLGTIGPWIGEWLYDGGFQLSRQLLILLSVQTIIAAGVLVIATGLRAMELPKLAFRGYATACGLSLAAGIPLTAYQGVEGAALGILIAVVGNAAVMLHAFLTLPIPTIPSPTAKPSPVA